MTEPIPAGALDDRLAFVGTAGTGKTYNASHAVERVLQRKHRAVTVDPLGVWWGLRLMPDGKAPSPFEVVIFGGVHGDLPLSPLAGAVIGETVAQMRESCILDLSGFKSGRERRRFMLDFLESLYESTDPRKVDPYHVIFDEADLWAPQKPIEDEHQRLQGRMEEIVRRGRVKGFIPWLITQRPAVLSKDVLSQVDGLVSFRLTSSQDREALGAWVAGQADELQWKPKGGGGLYNRLAEFQRAEGLVWIPSRKVMTVAAFPEKLTFDSSRTPERGKRASSRELRPLDVAGLKERLSTVEAEVKANDPAHLKAELAKAQAALLNAQRSAPAAHDPVIDWAAVRAALAKASAELKPHLEALATAANAFADDYARFRAQLTDRLAHVQAAMLDAQKAQPVAPAARQRTPAGTHAPEAVNGSRPCTDAEVKAELDRVYGPSKVSPSARKILDTIHAASPVSLSFSAAATRAGISKRSSQYRRYRDEVLSSHEVISAGDGRLWSAPGFAAPAPAGVTDPVEAWASRLPRAYGSMLKVVAAASPACLMRDEIAARAGVSRTSSGLGAGLRELLSLELITHDGGLYSLAEGLRS